MHLVIVSQAQITRCASCHFQSQTPPRLGLQLGILSQTNSACCVLRCAHRYTCSGPPHHGSVCPRTVRNSVALWSRISYLSIRGIWPMVRRKAVFERYAAQRASGHTERKVGTWTMMRMLNRH
eukprot:7352934-Prymnesium_polylepis.1